MLPGKTLIHSPRMLWLERESEWLLTSHPRAHLNLHSSSTDAENLPNH